jgi:hypothetical protein
MAITTAVIISALIKAAVYTAISIGVQLVANALRKKPKSSTGAADFEQTIQRRLRNGEPLEVLVGRRIVAGVGHFDDSHGTNLEYGVSISVMSAMPCTSFHRLFLDGEPVDLDGDPTTGERNVISHFLGIGDAPRVKVRIFLGNDNSGVGEYLNTKFPTKWSADDDFGDYCVVVLECRNTNDDLDEENGENKIPFQGYPDFKVELSGVKVCDPRIPGADYADPSTYVYSDNAALIDAQYDYGWYSGDPATEALIVGNGYPAELMNVAQVILNANYCDTENFGCSGLLRSGQNDDQQEIWKCYNAERVEHAAQVFSVPEGNREVDGTIDMADYPAAFVATYDPNGFSTEVYNEIKTTYAEPAEYYGEKELPIYSNPAWVAADNHIPRQLGLPLLFVTNLEQAAKLQKQEINMSRSAATVTIQDFPFDFIDKDVGKLVTIQNSDIAEINGRTWIIKGRGQSDRGDVMLSLREYGGTSAFTFNPATDTPSVSIQSPIARPWPWWGLEEYISADLISQVDAALDGIDTSAIREALMSTMVRLDELRRNIGTLGLVDGQPVGTRIERTEITINEVTNQLITVEETLISQINESQTLIQNLTDVQATDDDARASQIAALRSRVRNAETDIIEINEAYAREDEALSERIIALQSSVDSNVANIISQIQTLVTDLQAEAAQRDLLAALVDNAYAEIAEERRVRAEANEAAAQARSIILSQVNQNTGAIAVTQTALADLDSATTISLQQQSARIDNVSADLEVERTARVSAFEALVQEDTILRARLVDLEEGQSGTASQINTFEARVRQTELGIISISNQLNGVASQASTAQGQAAGNAQAINSLSTRVTATENSIVSQALSLNSVSATAGSAIAIASQAASAVADLEGNADSALVFRVAAGGQVASIETLAGTTYGSRLILDASVIELRGNVIASGTLTAAAFEGEGISINQDFTAGAVNISSSGAYTRVLSGTIRTTAKRKTVVGTVEVEFPIYGSNLAAWVQLRVGGIVRKTVYFNGAPGWPHTIPIASAFTISGDSSIEVWVRVIRNTALQGVSGARTRSCTLITQEMKT